MNRETPLTSQLVPENRKLPVLSCSLALKNQNLVIHQDLVLQDRVGEWLCYVIGN